MTGKKISNYTDTIVGVHEVHTENMWKFTTWRNVVWETS